MGWQYLESIAVNIPWHRNSTGTKRKRTIQKPKKDNVILEKSPKLMRDLIRVDKRS